MRLVQHKKEAWWFYRFLSIFYDKYVNPLFWTEQMRDSALELAQLNSPQLSVIDVGSGTGFTTQGIVKHVLNGQVICVDQSPHQMAKAVKKPDLQNCYFQIGDAENIPFEADRFDRYVSAGSIEYWPNPQRGIQEAYRVVKPGGVALLIGPLEPVSRFGRFVANAWMLFPKEEQYRTWFESAGFKNIQMRYVRPQWFYGKGKYGIAIAGMKPGVEGEKVIVPSGLAPSELVSLGKELSGKEQQINGHSTADKLGEMPPGRWLKLIGRVLIGSLAGFLFIPVALIGYLRSIVQPKENVPEHYRERLNGYQVAALLVIITMTAGLAWLIFS